MMDYFIGCNTAQDAKARYRKWAKELHPDHGGSHETMVEMQRQYDAFIPKVDVHTDFFKNTGTFDFNRVYEDSFKFHKNHFDKQSYIYENARLSQQVVKLTEANQRLISQLQAKERLVDNLRIAIESLASENHKLKNELSKLPRTFWQKLVALFR